MNDAPPLNDEEVEHLRTIRVCGCDDATPEACIYDTKRTHCPRAELDGIGADWIDDHFDSILATIDGQSADLNHERRRVEEYTKGTGERDTIIASMSAQLATFRDVLAAMSAEDWQAVVAGCGACGEAAQIEQSPDFHCERHDHLFAALVAIDAERRREATVPKSRAKSFSASGTWNV